MNKQERKIADAACKAIKCIGGNALTRGELNELSLEHESFVSNNPDKTFEQVVALQVKKLRNF